MLKIFAKAAMDQYVPRVSSLMEQPEERKMRLTEGRVDEQEVQILANQLAQAAQIIAVMDYEVIHPDASDQIKRGVYRGRRGHDGDGEEHRSPDQRAPK